MRAAGVVPPMTLSAEVMKIPEKPFCTTAVPVTFVPTKFPSIVFPPFVVSWMPWKPKPLMARPRTVQPPAVMVRPFAPSEFAPSRTILRTVFNPPVALVFSRASSAVVPVLSPWV